MHILIIGGGGREHAIAWSLSRSPQKPHLFITPGNGGTTSIGENVSLDASDHAAVGSFVKTHSIDLVVIGPEQPLVDGLSDYLRDHDVAVVGPSAAAAQLEGSKAFSKAFMQRQGIPTAAFETFTSGQLENALSFVRAEGAPIVVKASGLAAGKGAIVCETLDDAEQAVRSMMEEGSLGSAGSTVVVESFMSGEEASLFVLTDGQDYALLAPAQDHKRIGEGDTGLNTGGMGAYAPAPVMTDALIQEVCKLIVEPTLNGMALEGMPYQGILYVGLMITPDGPMVVEYNCRLGDPETQVVLPLMDADAVDVFKAMALGGIKNVRIGTFPGAAACVVLASGGYPGAYEKGKAISGAQGIDSETTVVFHAGTSTTPDGLRTSGGRVLAVTARAATLAQALEEVYRGTSQITFEGVQLRRDIGKKGLNRGV